MNELRDRDRDDRIGPGTYMTPEEAREFHKLFLMSFIIFTIVAIVAHILVWSWRPWLPGPDGYAMLDQGVALASATLSSMMA